MKDPAKSAGASDPASASGQERLQRALALAYRYLNRRERTVTEMRDQLARREVDASTVDTVIAILCEDGYVDDHRYARLLVEDKRALEGWGNERIRRVLRERGVDDDIVDAALDGTGADGELARALELLRRRMRVPPRDRRERDRALGILLRKGYESDVALEAINRYASADGVDDADEAA